MGLRLRLTDFYGVIKLAYCYYSDRWEFEQRDVSRIRRLANSTGTTGANTLT